MLSNLFLLTVCGLHCAPSLGISLPPPELFFYCQHIAAIHVILFGPEIFLCLVVWWSALAVSVVSFSLVQVISALLSNCVLNCLCFCPSTHPWMAMRYSWLGSTCFNMAHDSCALHTPQWSCLQSSPCMEGAAGFYSRDANCPEQPPMVSEF